MIKTFFTPKPKNSLLKTNIKSFDDLIGGGLPLGKIIEFVGETDTGKTTFLFDIIESLKDSDVVVAYIATSTKSLSFLKERNLISNDNLMLLISNDEDQILDFIRKSVNIVDLFIVDSVPEILTNNEKIGFDMNVNQNVPKLLSEFNTIMYGESSVLITVNYLIYKDNANIPRWNNLFNRYCTVRVEILAKNSLRLISHKLKPELVNGGENYGM